MLLAALLIVVGGWSAVFLEWRQPAFSADPQVQWSVGPFRAGDAFTQRFPANLSHLGGIEVSLRAPPGELTGHDAVLHFRLLEGGEAVREGVVEVEGLEDARRTVSWSFPPIVDSAGREYELQVVVAEVSGAGLLADTTTVDLLPGSIVSNGTPSGGHFDLVLHAYRQVNRRGLVDILARTVPGGVVTLAIFVVGAGSIGGIGLHRLRGGGISARRGLVAPLLAGIVAVSFVELIPLAKYQSLPGAEVDPDFVFATRGLALAFAMTPWLVSLGAGALGRRDRLARSRQAGRLLIAAVVTTVLAALLLVFTAEPEYFQLIDVMDEERPAQGRIPWLGQNPAASFGRVALVLWLAVAVSGCFDGRAVPPWIRRPR